MDEITAPSAPLTGIRVVEFATAVSGPYAAMMLAESGADVIKVEAPSGDMTRDLGPHLEGSSLYFINFNRGKRSVVIDLRSEKGRHDARQLCQGADVVIENWRPGVAERMGLTYDSLVKDNPGLIYVSIRGFPEAHPRAQERVYDAVIQGASSLASSQGAEGVPQMINTILPDKLTSLAAVQAILNALLLRHQNGQGRRVELSMLQSTISFLWPEMMRHLSTEKRPDGFEDFSPSNRTARLYETKDHLWVVLSAVTDQQWAAFCDLTDSHEITNRFPTAPLRISNTKIVAEIVKKIVASFDRSDFLQLMSKAEIPCSEVVSPSDLVEDEVLYDLGILRRVYRDALGTTIEPMPFGCLTPDDWRSSSAAPSLGQDNETVLRSLPTKS